MAGHTCSGRTADQKVLERAVGLVEDNGLDRVELLEAFKAGLTELKKPRRCRSDTLRTTRRAVPTTYSRTGTAPDHGCTE